MKYLTLLYLLAGACLFASCKKDSQLTPTKVAKPDPETLLTDSASFSINGQSYVFDSLYGMKVQNIDANRKVDSIVNYAYYISGKNKDSILFLRSYDMSGSSNNKFLSLTIFKKYHTNQLQIPSALTTVLTPKDPFDLVKPGAYIFATDYMRENAHNGVAIDITNTESSYSSHTLGTPTTITQDKEQDAKFQLTTFKQLKSGKYLLEATFNATVFDKAETPAKVENGYIRLILN